MSIPPTVSLRVKSLRARILANERSAKALMRLTRELMRVVENLSDELEDLGARTLPRLRARHYRKILANPRRFPVLQPRAERWRQRWAA